MVHELKILPEYFGKVVLGEKTFEVRKKDRDFKVGDFVLLKAWWNDQYTGQSIMTRITYILDNPDYCKEGYVIFGIKVLQ